ncbi:MAG: glutaredoxin family protein [Candidatus Woesearchaeota archaeon]
MKTKWIFYGIGIVLVGILIAGIAMPSKYDEFAKCVAEQDVTMYGTEWCSYCHQQKELFGSSFEYVDYVDCDYNKQVCDANSVNGYPTWTINGQKYSGVQSLEKISSLTQCEL